MKKVLLSLALASCLATPAYTFTLEKKQAKSLAKAIVGSLVAHSQLGTVLNTTRQWCNGNGFDKSGFIHMAIFAYSTYKGYQGFSELS